MAHLIRSVLFASANPMTEFIILPDEENDIFWRLGDIVHSIDIN